LVLTRKKEEQQEHDKDKTKVDTKTMDLGQRITILEAKVDSMDESWSRVGGQQVHMMKQLEQTVRELQQKVDRLEQANRESRPDASLIKMGYAELSRHEQLIARLEKLCAHQDRQSERQAEINEELQTDIIHLQGSLGQYR
jgi:exonuclease VII small subunit